MIPVRLWLASCVVLASVLTFACGADSDEGREVGDIDMGREAFPGVPVRTGAEEKDHGEVGALPFGVPGSTVDPEDFTTLEFRTYEVEDLPADVIDFYHNELDGWEEIAALSVGGESGGGFGVWTRGDEEALWVGARRSGGVTELIVVLGSSN